MLVKTHRTNAGPRVVAPGFGSGEKTTGLERERPLTRVTSPNIIKCAADQSKSVFATLKLISKIKNIYPWWLD